MPATRSVNDVPRNLQVARFLAMGLTHAEIAQMTGIQARYVKNYVYEARKAYRLRVGFEKQDYVKAMLKMIEGVVPSNVLSACSRDMQMSLRNLEEGE